MEDTFRYIKDENKIDTLQNLAKLYACIPLFEGQLEQNISNIYKYNNKININLFFNLLKKNLKLN